MRRHVSLGAAALLAAACLTFAGCPGGSTKDAGAGGDSAGAARDTSQPQPNLPPSDSARGGAAAGDTARGAPGTVRDTAQPQPRLPSGSGGAATKPGGSATTTTAGGGTKAAATKTSRGGASGGASGGTSGSEDDSARIRRLEQEARALAKVTGCSESEQCRAAPVGHRPCGGPRTYIPYCARTTDSAALFRKLEQLAQAERDYNAKRGIASTCDFRSPPPVEASSNSCHLRTAQPGAGRVSP